MPASCLRQFRRYVADEEEEVLGAAAIATTIVVEY